ncbi:MAG: hypothetical protein ACHQQQ_05295 [Bacteroidota bacterium]
MHNSPKNANWESRFSLLLVFLLIGGIANTSYSGEKLIIQLKDYTRNEVKTGGFTLTGDTQLKIHALGAGVNERGIFSGSDDLFAYGWIINSETREAVWEMRRSNTSSLKSDRVFDGDINLPAGSYEVYFTAFAFSGNSPFSSFSINIDRRKEPTGSGKVDHEGFFTWLYKFFGEDIDKEWNHRAKEWGIEIYDESPGNRDILAFASPKEFPRILYKSVKIGENEHIVQAFTLAKPMPIHIYAIGEMGTSREPADYSWILNATTRERVWEMNAENTTGAGGARKNMKFDNTVNFSAGEYVLYYISDDSHSFLDWNQAPPYDPYNYGVTLMAANEKEEDAFKLHAINEEKNIIAQIIRVRNNETRSESFTLKSDVKVRIYALGERASARGQMADFGTIINAKTREKVWSMDAVAGEYAGGASKNRYVDEIVTLPKGTYTVNYQTDDSHAYNQWNDSPPFDPEHWGISIYLVDEMDWNKVEKNVTPKMEGVIAQIVKVGDNANKTEYFTLNKPTHVRIYALGEGQNGEMYDYGWIENEASGERVWEMTYSMTFHAGGGRKNRLVNITILLDKGKYKLRYVSDDSHSYNNWNTDPPEDPTMWGITLYENEHQQ